MILALIVGSIFYKLAEKYNESKWGFAIAGIAVYFGSTFIGGIILGVFSLILDFDIESLSRITLTLISIVFGVVACSIFYRLLEKKWKKKVLVNKDEIDLIGKVDDSENEKAN